MKLGKTARVAWLNIFRGILLAATLELPWPHALHWLWNVVNWGSAVMVLGSIGVLGMCGLLNACWLIEWALTDDPPYEPRGPVTGDRVPVGVSRHGVMVTVRASALAENRVSSTLRYLGPPPVYVPGYARPEPWHPAATCGGCGQVIVPVRTETRVYYFCPDCTDAPDGLRRAYGNGAGY